MGMANLVITINGHAILVMGEEYDNQKTAISISIDRYYKLAREIRGDNDNGIKEIIIKEISIQR